MPFRYIMLNIKYYRNRSDASLVSRKGQPQQIQGGGTVNESCQVLFLQVLSHIKLEAFTSSNYISEHSDCLIHSFHYKMKAVFSFHLAQKKDFCRCPSVLPLRNLKCFKHFKLQGKTIMWFRGVCREQMSVLDSFAQVLPMK